MASINVQNIINYWIKISKRDMETVDSMYEARRYPESLFFTHLMLEKILKAHVVLETEKHAPYIHNLIDLMDRGNLKLEIQEIRLLSVANGFNIHARYPDYKQKVYKRYNNREFALNKINQAKNLHKKLCRELNKKRKPEK